MRHPLEHVGYLATPLDLVRIFAHRGRKAVMFCAFEIIGGQFCVAGQSLNSHLSHYGFVSTIAMAMSWIFFPAFNAISTTTGMYLPSPCDFRSETVPSRMM
jgi:hypothetical protein